MIALVIDVPAGDAELAADALWGLGVVAVEERAGVAGRVELWTSLGDDRQVALDAVAGFPEHWEARLEHVDDEVVDTWRAFAEPTWIDDGLVIWPAWMDVDGGSVPDGVGDVTRGPTADVTVLRIEPGSTFGMGDHPTTVLSLRALRRVIDGDLGQEVLDVGCGSGVLAIAAVCSGAVSAVAIDISPAAEVMTNDNARRNAVGDLITASTRSLHEIRGEFDVVVANILAPTLVELSVELQRVLAADGSLIISGILADRHAHVLEALQPLRVVQVDELDGWAAVTLQR
jgi:ribosomal protein L11 methyltransferase